MRNPLLTNRGKCGIIKKRLRVCRCCQSVIEYNQPLSLYADGADTPEVYRHFYTIGEFYMYFQVIATHNPQDFFCGQEPNDLTLTFIVKEDALMETVKQCIIGGYIAIVYPFENKNN